MRRSAWATIGVAALVIVACASTRPLAAQPSARGAWARTTMEGQSNGVVYLTIAGGRRTDVLVGASVPDSVAAGAMIHRTTGAGTGAAMAGMDMTGEGGDGMTRMSAVSNVHIHPGQVTRFEPGGYHVMLMGLRHALMRGSHFKLSLAFDRAGTIVVPVTVRDREP